MLIVQKYGGTSLAGMSRLRAAARRVTGLARQGNQVVVVVSAQGDTTDMLIEKATQVNRRGSAREMDAYLAAGEQMSAGLMTMAIGAMGYSAVSLTGWQAGIRTDGVHGNARIQNIDVARIRQQLDAGKIVVVAGFQGVDTAGDVTTLGRGGSDTSAVALAAFLGAERCIIYTDVDGVYTTDPRVIKARARVFFAATAAERSFHHEHRPRICPVTAGAGPDGRRDRPRVPADLLGAGGGADRDGDGQREGAVLSG